MSRIRSVLVSVMILTISVWTLGCGRAKTIQRGYDDVKQRADEIKKNASQP